MRVLELANGWYSKSSFSSNKGAAKEYVLIWCKAVHEMRIAEHNAIFQGLLTHASNKRDGTNAASSASEGDADDDDALAAEGASEDDAPDAAAANISAAGA